MTNLALRARVELDLEMKCSPEQIAGRLRGDYPDDPEMWVSTETIYQSLYVSPVARCAVTWPNACAPAARCANPTARAPIARTVSCRT